MMNNRWYYRLYLATSVRGLNACIKAIEVHKNVRTCYEYFLVTKRVAKCRR